MEKNICSFVGEGKNLNKWFRYTVLVFLLFLFTILLSINASAQYTQRNVTARVNVTNAGPEVLTFYIQNPITLSAGSYYTAYCNTTIRDYNGYNDIDVVNATFYHITNTSADPDDNNTHYTTTNCTKLSDDGNFLANYSCSFNLSYIAFNGTWYCNVTVNDTRSYIGMSRNATNISALYALNVTSMIDYGDLSVTDYSENKTATVTNFGNMNINVSVLGYGATQGDGLGFVCTQGSNISVQYQRFTSNISADWADKVALASTNKDVGMTLQRQIDDAVQVTGDTYWQLYVPPNPFGVCTGTVRFTATAP